MAALWLTSDGAQAVLTIVGGVELLQRILDLSGMV
jgi:hypothetical protein